MITRVAVLIFLFAAGCHKAAPNEPPSSQMNGNPRVASVEDAHRVLDAPASGPIAEAWRQCTSDTDCVAISSRCGITFVNAQSRQAAEVAWRAACEQEHPAQTDLEGELGKRPSPTCRASRCMEASDLGGQVLGN